jgi:putative nucleotidyltransferase with HDIG domain
VWADCVPLVSWAHDLSRSLLAEALPQRWRHSLGVARQAASLRDLDGLDGDVLGAAALLHDIGYSPALVDTGFHPVDGARFLRHEVAADERVVSLVAYHSCAFLEAEVRVLVSELAEFAPGCALMSDALIYCDMTTSPDGIEVTPAERIAEIIDRYEPDGPVGRFIRVARPSLCAASERIGRVLAQARPPIVGVRGE